MKYLRYLLAFVPVSGVMSLAAPHTPVNEALLFLFACLAIVPLAGYMGEATDELAKRLGPNLGSLLNATFGNATELIITIFALKAGLMDVVQASITGSILGNILLVLGFAFIAGSWKRDAVRFNTTLASTHTSMLLLAVAALFIPAMFVHSQPGMSHEHGEIHNMPVWHLSLAVSAILIVVYVLGLFFSLKTHRSVFHGGEEGEPPVWTLSRGMLVLAVSTLFVAWMSEILVSSVEPMTQALGLSPLFVGVIIIPIIGNAAEHSTAVTMAAQDKMDVALGIAIGSSTQVALLVAPLLVFISAAMGRHLSIIFSRPELVAVAFGVMIVAFVAHDGEAHWLEGVQLLAVYAIIALAFYFVLPGVPRPAH